MGLEKKSEFDYFIIKRPLNGDVFCGDTGLIREFDSKAFIGVVDVLGHGREADEVAGICENFLEKNYKRNLVEIITGLHDHIKGSRGAVAGFCLLDTKTGGLECVKVGNIVIKKFGSHNKSIISRDGIIGYIMETPKNFKMDLFEGDVLLLHTDGITSRFDLDDYPELPNDNARTIATKIMERFGKKNDDALCIALKYKKNEKNNRA